MSEIYPTVTDTKRKGRPPLNREIDKQADALAEKSVLPNPPGKTISFDQMQEYFQLLTPDMWSHAVVYLYRTRPRIIRQLKDPEAKNYIDVVSQPLTMDYLIDRHGGGRYQVEMTNTDIPHNRPGPADPNRGHMFRCNFEIDEVRYPPKLDYEELDIAHRDNMSYIALLKHNGVLGQDGKPIKPGQPTNNGATAGGALNTEGLKEILSFVTTMTTAQQNALRQRLAPNEDESSLSKSLGTILVERMRQDNPSTQMQSLQTLITAVKEIVASSKPADTNTSMYGPLITMLGEQNKTLMGMMERIANPRGGGDSHGGDEMTRFNSMLDMVTKIGELTGRGGRRSGWDVGLDYVREIVPPVMGTLQQILPWMRRGPAAAPAAAGQAAPAVPQVFDPYRDVAAMRAYSDQMRNQAPAAMPQPQPGMPAQQQQAGPPPASELHGVLRQYSAIVVNAMNNGTDGADFADWLTGLLGAQTHALLSQPGEEILTSTMMQIPEIAIFGAVKLRGFAHNFCCFEEILDGRDKGDGGGDGALNAA